MEPKKTAIEVENLSIGYTKGKQEQLILKNINFEIPEGELIGIIGANGTGKSTLLRTLAHQQPKLFGKISINQSPIEEYTIASWATQVSWVHTESLIPKGLSIFELVSLGRQPYTNWLDKLTNIDLKKIKEALDLTDLTDLQNENCSTLSDGQLQRVFIARAIAQDTPIIFLDEPTTHLDLHFKVETLILLKKLCNTLGKTIVFSTHEIEFCLQICDKVISITQKEIKINTINDLIKFSILDQLFPNSKLFFEKKSKLFKIRQ